MTDEALRSDRSTVAGLLLCAVALLMNSADVAAFEGHTVCNSCTEPQVSRAALDAAPPGNSNLYVLDLDARGIARFAVRKESEPGSYIEMARRVPLDAATQAEFDQLVAALDEIARTKDLSIPSDVAQSAFGVVRSPYRMARVTDHFNNGDIWARFRNHFSLVGQSMASAVGQTYRVIAATHFADGTSYQFELTLARRPDGTPIIVATPVAGSGRDAEGGLIPETARDYTGVQSVLGNASALQDFLDHALANGVTVCMAELCFSSGHSDVPGRPWPARCREANGEIRCTRQ